MRFSFWLGNEHPWSEIRRSAQRSEEAGWDGLWFADHFMPNSSNRVGPVHEVWPILSALGEVTSTVRLGPLVCGNTYRNPALLAKLAVAADHVAEGRIVLGIGAGWQENEHVAYGFEFGTFGQRFEKLEEALQILLSLRDNDLTSFNGQHYQMVEAPLSPKPAGSLPIMIGGGGEKKTLRMVAQYADEWNVWADVEIMRHKVAVLDRHCERLQRDPGSIQRSLVALLYLCDSESSSAALRAKGTSRPSLIGTVQQLRAQVAELVAMGVDEIIVPDFNLGEPRKKDETSDRFLTEVASAFR